MREDCFGEMPWCREDQKDCLCPVILPCWKRWLIVLEEHERNVNATDRLGLIQQLPPYVLLK